MLLQKLTSLSVFTLATITFLSFSSITKAENIPQTDVTTPDSSAVVLDRTQIPTDINSQSETIDRNTNNTQSIESDRDLPSNSAVKVDKCAEQ